MSTVERLKLIENGEHRTHKGSKNCLNHDLKKFDINCLIDSHRTFHLIGVYVELVPSFVPKAQLITRNQNNTMYVGVSFHNNSLDNWFLKITDLKRSDF